MSSFADSVMNTQRSSAGDFSSALKSSLTENFYLVRQAAQHPQDWIELATAVSEKTNTSVSDALIMQTQSIN